MSTSKNQLNFQTKAFKATSLISKTKSLNAKQQLKFQAKPQVPKKTSSTKQHSQHTTVNAETKLKFQNKAEAPKTKQTLKFKNEFLTSPKNKLNVRKQKGLNFKK